MDWHTTQSEDGYLFSGLWKGKVRGREKGNEERNRMRERGSERKREEEAWEREKEPWQQLPLWERDGKEGAQTGSRRKILLPLQWGGESVGLVS